MFRILESQAPAKQTATDTIATLCSRLQSATLLEDRRNAILGLRSFAKSFPASVASGSLRNLINTLSTQRDDPDTLKTVLETLLMLFTPDADSPEASEDIVTWLADEFTVKQENITLLLDLLEEGEFFARLFTLQLISAISGLRPERAQECVFVAPLGVSRLVGVLDDNREAIRAEALLLLTALTPGNVEFQKMVAFENAFDRIFRIIEQEGGLTGGDVVVQDCLSLLANLLRLNSSNQMAFRETGGPKRTANLLRPLVEPKKEGDDQGTWNLEQRDRNLWGVLSIIRLFLLGGGSAAQRNQAEFWKQGVTNQVLDIAFSPDMSTTIQAEALATVADLIRKNPQLQEQFSRREVTLHIGPSRTKSPGPQVNGHKDNEVKFNIIQALLDLCLNVSAVHELEIRIAACECVKAYLQGHKGIRTFFLQRACAGHMDVKSAEPDNIISILLESLDTHGASDTYRQWIAATIFMHLVIDEHDTKQIAMGVSEGDAEQGEEVVTCIQNLAANLLSRSDRGDDERLSIAYLMVLSAWLFEEPDAINDFLQEGSNLQGLTTLVIRNHHTQPIVAGLGSFLLGIIYEFSTKDSPIPRSTVHNILTSKLGRDLYDASLTRLREDPAVRDFEVAPLADPLFDRTYVDFLKDNFSRIQRAIEREPDLEISVNVGGVEKGVSREQIDLLRAQHDEQSKALDEAQERIQSLERQLGQAEANHRRERESAQVEIQRIGSVNTALQKNHESELQSLRSQSQQAEVDARSRHAMEIKSARDETALLRKTHESETQRLQGTHAQALKDAQGKHTAELAQVRKSMQAQLDEAHDSASKLSSSHAAELQDLRTRLDKAEKALEKANREHAQDLKTAYDEHEEARKGLAGRLERAEGRAEQAEKREKVAKAALDKAKEMAYKAEGQVKEKEEERKAAQAELDEFLLVLSDMEEKKGRYKKRLKELGEEVSEGEDDDEEDEDDDDEEEENGDEEEKDEDVD